MKKYIVIALPVIDYPVKGYGPHEQRMKLYEEIEELWKEAEAGNMDTRKLLAEYIDVGQMIAGLIRSRAREDLTGSSLDKVAFDVFVRANEEHLKKMHRYADERGWTILSGNSEKTQPFFDRTIGKDNTVHPLSSCPIYR